ncbi:MAG: hypothetical protein JW882_09600 [Deltaproteobacteria bacterium]|nr:hypothetical protein [Deltaproteobacteria bacterium]
MVNYLIWPVKHQSSNLFSGLSPPYPEEKKKIKRNIAGVLLTTFRWSIPAAIKDDAKALTCLLSYRSPKPPKPDLPRILIVYENSCALVKFQFRH